MGDSMGDALGDTGGPGNFSRPGGGRPGDGRWPGRPPVPAQFRPQEGEDRGPWWLAYEPAPAPAPYPARQYVPPRLVPAQYVPPENGPAQPRYGPAQPRYAAQDDYPPPHYTPPLPPGWDGARIVRSILTAVGSVAGAVAATWLRRFRSAEASA